MIDRGTGAAIRSRYGIRADLAGKTGTTQDNTDGWFILMHPQLVAGAWVGFNDGRVTLRSDYWGQGAHSALPIVGDFTSQALRARLIDPRVRFLEPKDTSLIGPLMGGLGNWVRSLFGSTPVPVKSPEPRPAPPPAAEPIPEPPVAPASAPEIPLEPLPEEIILPSERLDPVNIVPPASAPGF